MKTLTVEDQYVLEAAIAAHGPISQLNIVVEECIELAEQLDIMLSNMAGQRRLYPTYTDADRENLLDEIADVYIVSQEFLIIYEVDASCEWADAYTLAFAEFGDKLCPQKMAQTTNSMLLKIVLAVLKLQREYTPDLHKNWKSAARGFGIVQHFIEKLAVFVGDTEHERVDERVDMKISRLKSRLGNEGGATGDARR